VRAKAQNNILFYPLAKANGKGYRPDQSMLIFKSLFFADGY